MVMNGRIPTELVRDAHAAGLRVHPWTFRAENYFLPSPYRKGINPRGHGDVAGEIRDPLRAGIDGVFTDFPALGVEAGDEARAAATARSAGGGGKPFTCRWVRRGS